MSEQRDKVQSGRKGYKKFEGEGGLKYCISRRRGQIEQWRYTSRRSPRRKSLCYLQKKQGRSMGGSSRSESWQEF